MSMKKQALLLGMLMATGGMPNMYSSRRISSTTPKKAPIPPGMKEWNINGQKVMAATKKAAIKKANKLNNK